MCNTGFVQCTSLLPPILEKRPRCQQLAGLDINSYGTGKYFKLPGPSIHEPNVYDFSTPYNAIYGDIRHPALLVWEHEAQFRIAASSFMMMLTEY